ncbi:MAG TPA: hypothetical protein VFV94_03125 [Polyangiaceae bacterium]|nr:hypothetical protein [Polyangiaceae bacterium]
MAGRRPQLRALVATLTLGLAACESRAVPADAGPSEPSPNASILPAPLATGPDTVRAAPDAGPTDGGVDAEVPPPSPAREDEALPTDLEELHDPSGLTLRARFRWPDVGAAGRLPEANLEALERARQASSFELDIVAAADGRLRVALPSSRFVLASGSELRARSDRYGHVLLWPDRNRYVVIQAGALRAVLNERRADVVPLAHVTGTSRGAGQALGYATERAQFTSSLGKVALEQAQVTGAGLGGALLCRLVLELGGVHPDSPACGPDLVPVRAEYTWSEGGAVVFETTALERTSVVDQSMLRTPPEGAEHRIGELPLPPTALLLERAQLRSLRLRPASVRPNKDAPKEGLLLVNGDDVLRYALVDSVPVARLEPHGTGLLVDLVAGTYAVGARTFLGDEITPSATLTVPGRLVTGEAPRGEPPGAETPEGTPAARIPRPAPPRRAE